MEEARNRNIRIGIVDNDPYALKVFGALIERMSSDFAVIWTCDLGAVAISRCLSPTKRPDVLVTDMSMGALDRTHQVIDVIEGRGEAAHSAVTPHDSTVDAAPGIACDITDADCPLETQTYPPAPVSTVTNNY